MLLDTLKVACPYAPDNRLFVTCLPAESVKRKVAHAVRSRRRDIISLAEMDWLWDILRVADLLSRTVRCVDSCHQEPIKVLFVLLHESIQ